MTARQPIQPAYGTGAVLTPAAAAATVALAASNKQIILTNLGLNVCYVRVGQTTVADASTADYPVPAGAQVVITKSQYDDRLSHISAAGTTLHIMSGEGF